MNITTTTSSKDAWTAPATGIYHDVPFANYCEWPVINISTLAWAATSLEHLKAAVDRKIETDSDAKGFGRAVHCKILEPERFHHEYLISMPCDAILQSGPSKGKLCGCYASLYAAEDESWRCGKHPRDGCVEPDNVISDVERICIERMVEKIRGHEVFKVFRLSKTGFEASVLWEPRPGLTAKCRLDKLIISPHGNYIIDLKKVGQFGHASYEKFQRTIVNYGYDARAAFYVDAVRQVAGLDADPIFLWVAIEDKYPFYCRVYDASPSLLNTGREIYNDWIDKYLRAVDSGVWSDPAERDTQTMHEPDWRAR